MSRIGSVETFAVCHGILNSIPAAAYMCDASGLITFFNPTAEVVWGRTPILGDAREKYCGSHRLYLLDGTPIRHEECWMARALLEGNAQSGCDIVIERRDGARTIGEAHAHPLRNSRGQIVGALNLVADVTQLRGKRAGDLKLDHASIEYYATREMISIVVSLLTAIAWESASPT